MSVDDMIILSNENNSTIVCSNKTIKESIIERAKIIGMNIKDPLTTYNYVKRCRKGEIISVIISDIESVKKHFNLFK